MFKKLYDDVEKGKANIDNRVLGHVRFSPSIKPRAGSNKCTRDYALVEIGRSRMDSANFTGNVINFSTQIASDELTRLLFPNPKNRHTFEYSGKNQQRTQAVFNALFPTAMSYEIPDQPPLQGPGYRPGRRDALSCHVGPERRSVLHRHEARQYHWSDRRPR